MKFNYGRLSWTRERDYVLGPFLFAPAGKHDHGWALVADSGRGEDDFDGGATLRLTLRGHTFILALPQWLVQPERHKVVAESWDEATVKRLGRNWYWNVIRRCYGISLSEGGFVQLKFGRQAGDSRLDQNACWHLPWLQWRFVRHSHLTAEGEVIRSFLGPRVPWMEQHAFEQTLPTHDFEFADFDGEKIIARTRIEEREWRLGEGGFKWLSRFARPRVQRTLDLSFSSEVGERKGSWKGGTIGHSTEINTGETPEAAFRRYCAKRGMTFLRAVAGGAK